MTQLIAPNIFASPSSGVAPTDGASGAASGAPGDAASGAPDPAATQPIAAPAPEPSEAVRGADELREAVSRNRTVGDIVGTLDSYSLGIGQTTISLWDVAVVVLVIGFVIIGAMLASRMLKTVLNRITRLNIAQRLLAEKLVSILVWAIAVMIGIDTLGIDLTTFTVFSGAFGLAIGFGLQKTFGNLISGIILLMDRSIKPGDVIALSDQAGNETFGQIRRIGIRAVSVTTRDEREYLIPNENLMINQVENWSYSSRKVRIQVPVGIDYASDIVRAEELMLEAAGQVKRILKDPAPGVWLTGYGDSSIDFVIQCWITDPEEGVGNVRSEVLKTLWRLFRDNGVEIPFPQRDINLRGNAEFEQLIAAIAQRLGDQGDGRAGQSASNHGDSEASDSSPTG